MRLFRPHRSAATSGGLRQFTSIYVVLSLFLGLFVVFISSPRNTLAATSLPDGTIGTSYFFQLYSCPKGCFSNYTGTLPPGLDIVDDPTNRDVVNLLGTPTQVGTYTFQVTFSNLSESPIKTEEFTIKIVTPPPPPPVGQPGFASDPKPGQTLHIRAQTGKPGTSSILISETGNATLSVYVLGISGANAADFKVISPASSTITIADGGAAQSIIIQCTSSALGKRIASLQLESNDPNYAFNNYSLVCDNSDEEKLPADLVLQLRVTPDRQAKISPETNITFDLKVTNVGPGVAYAVRLLFPIDPNLLPAYTSFSDGRMWVSEKVMDGDKPYLKIAMPPIQPGQSFSATLIFHPKAGAKGDAIVREQFTSGWDDQVHAGMTSSSNSVMVTLIDPGNSRDDTRGAVMLFPQHGQIVELNKSLTLTADFYSPNEAVDFWYTDADNNSVALGMFWTNPNGKLMLEFSATGLKEGKTYTIVGKGRRSGIMGSAAITVTAAKPSNNNSSQKPATTHK